MTPDIQKTLDKLRAKTVFQIGFEGAPDPVRQEQEPSALNLEAAALIERLAGALEPFSRLADEIEALAGISDAPYDNPENWAKSCGWSDLIAARAALSGEPTL